MTLSCIVAVSENGVIGRNKSLPWKLSADLRRFKQLTTGHAIIMGRKTFDSIGRPLPNRISIVLTRNRDYAPPGVMVVHSFDQAVAACQDQQEAFVIGGEAVFREALPRTKRLHLTRVHANIEGDAYFPETDLADWKLLDQEHHSEDERNDYAFTFYVYERP